MIDVGVVRPHQVVARVVSVRNETGRPLTVSTVSTSCSCVRARVWPSAVPTGSVYNVAIEYRGVDSVVDDRKGVTVRFSDPNLAPASIVVVAHDRPDYTLQPDGMKFQISPGDASAAEWCDVANFTGFRWRTFSVSSPVPWLTVEAARSRMEGVGGPGAADDIWRIVGRLDTAKVPGGVFNGKLDGRAVGSDGQTRHMSIPVYVEERPDADLRPISVVLRAGHARHADDARTSNFLP
jgi:hypothetical protein